MKQKALLFLLLLIALGAAAQTNTHFPNTFVGHWKGTLLWYKDTVQAPEPINMELHVQPSTDTAGQYTWNIIYGSPSKDNRPYLLKAVDAPKGHWVIDEKNGILLDQYWKADRFTGAFTVGNSTIVNSYWLEKDKLMVEFIVYAAKPLATTGLGTEDSPKVDSYAIKSYQKGMLSQSK